MTTKVYFDRTLPFYLTNELTFNGVMVDIDPSYIGIVKEIRALVDTTEKAIVEAASPERSNQALAEQFIKGLEEIINGY